MSRLLHAIQYLPMSYYAFAGILNFLTTCALGLFVLIKHPRDQTHRLFGLWSLIVAHWGWGYFLWASSGEAAPLYVRPLLLSPAIMPAVFLDFTAAFTGTRLPRWLRTTNYALGLGFAALAYHPTLLLAGTQSIMGFPYYPAGGPLMPVHALHFAGNFVWAHALMLRKLPNTQGLFRQQLSVMGFGTLIAYLGGGMNYLPIFHLPIPPFLTPLVTIYVACVAYGMMRLQLLDMRIAVTKTGLMIGTYLIVLGVPVGLSVWGRAWLQRWLGEYWWAVPVGFSTLLASIGPFVYGRLWNQARGRLLQELSRKEAELAKTQTEASLDALTGLLVRRAFTERAELALARARQLHQPCTLLMVDLDHFKEKNDVHGHLVGDAVLKETAARLQQAIRPQDLCGRYGGEELILLLDGLTPEDVLPVAERLRASVAGAPIANHGLELSQTLSIGVSGFPEDAADLQGLIGKADQALYTAKRSGRNRVVRL